MTKAEQAITPDQAIAALERAAHLVAVHQPSGDGAGYDYAILCALAAALKQTQERWQNLNFPLSFRGTEDEPLESMMPFWRSVWIITEPRIEPGATRFVSTTETALTDLLLRGLSAEHFGTIAFHAGVYQNPPPDVSGKRVVVVDFSYKRPVMEKMIAEADSVLVLDHPG